MLCCADVSVVAPRAKGLRPHEGLLWSHTFARRGQSPEAAPVNVPAGAGAVIVPAIQQVAANSLASHSPAKAALTRGFADAGVRNVAGAAGGGPRRKLDVC